MNDLANVSVSAYLVGQLSSILHVLGFSPACYLPMAFSCLLRLCVLCVSSWESLQKSEKFGLFSAVGMLMLLPMQFVALVMKQRAVTKDFSHSDYMGILELHMS